VLEGLEHARVNAISYLGLSSLSTVRHGLSAGSDEPTGTSS
jgi:hypothetical protein